MFMISSGGDLEGILLEDHEVGLLAGLQRAEAVALADLRAPRPR